MQKVLLHTLLIGSAMLVFPWFNWQAIAAAVPSGAKESSVAQADSSGSPSVALDDPSSQSLNLDTTSPSPLQPSTDASTSETPPDPMLIQEEQQNIDANDPLAQVTSVSQLSDVQPTDWAFQALQSLVERYGCIVGYPDSTYRGNRPLTRYEFAAGLNACLDRVNELIATATSELVRKEDLVTIQRLQEDFAGELASIRGRVDFLEANVAELEANQFSTTTKLNGLAWFNLTGATAGRRVRVEATPESINGPSAFRAAGRDASGRPFVQRVDDPSITFSALTWLTLNTSFNGADSLVVQLAAGNGDSPTNQFASAGLYNTFGVPFFDQTGGPNIGVNDVVIRDFFYSFPVGDTLQVVIGPRINWYRFFDNNRFTFILDGANSFNSNSSTLLNTIDRGSGLALLWQPSKQFALHVAYLGENDEFLPSGLFNSSSNPSQGLFGGTYTATAELTFSPSDNFNLRLLYNRSRIQQIFGQIGGAIGEPLYGLADDGFGGPLYSATADTYEANFDWLITSGFGIFGRYTYGSTHLNPRTPGRPSGDVNAQAVQGGLAFLDFGKEGAQLTLSYVIPFSILDGREFLVSGGGNGGVQFDIEANYFFPVTDNIAIVPAFYYIANANNFTDNPDIFVGNLRVQFSF